MLELSGQVLPHSALNLFHLRQPNSYDDVRSFFLCCYCIDSSPISQIQGGNSVLRSEVRIDRCCRLTDIEPCHKVDIPVSMRTGNQCSLQSSCTVYC